MIGSNWKDVGITPPRGKHNGSAKVLCPKCSHTRRNKPDDPCLSITFDKTDSRSGKPCHLFHCHHCHYRGAVFLDGIPSGDFDVMTYAKTEYRKPDIKVDDYDLTEEVIEWFAKRGIREDTLNRLKIKAVEWTFEKSRGDEPAIMFPSFKDRELINAQFRNLGDGKTKRYRSIGGCQLIYYGFDRVVAGGHILTNRVIVTEGYIDAATAEQCGFPFTMSVPNGSPFEEEGKPEVTNPKMDFHNDPDAQYLFSHVDKVVFAGDDDFQGRKLVKELATRVGIEKCYRVTYPEGCKDLNEVLVMYGEAKVIETIERAERFPVEGVIRISQLRDEVKQLYTTGFDTGLTTGFPNLDPYFRVGLGKVILLTGVPESGKSRLMANFCNNLSDLHGIKWSGFTPENRPFGTYAAKMAQIRTKKPFGKPGDDDRMSEEELDAAMNWMDQYFTFNSPADRSLSKILEIWKYQLMTEGTRYGIIDPFNYVARPDGKVDEAQFILKFLVELADWCAKNNCTAFVVAHPTKVETIKTKDPDDPRNGEYPVITPYRISGSAHWNNCADFILSIWRSVNHRDQPVRLHVLKAKQEELGTSNEHADFVYDVKTGIYLPHDVHYRDEDKYVPFNEEEEEPPPRRRARRASA